MKTFLLKKTDVNRKWYHIDAAGLTLGKLSVKIASLLNGKASPTYTPHIDSGDFVIVTNCDKFLLSGNKAEEKRYYSHSRYAKDGLKVQTIEQKSRKNPGFVIEHAVRGMIKNNKLRDGMMMRLKTFQGDEHTHGAQQPITITL